MNSLSATFASDVASLGEDRVTRYEQGSNRDIPEVEIAEIPPLSPREHSLLGMHALLNIFNVLRGELVLIGLGLENDDTLLRRGLSLCSKLVAELPQQSATLASARATGKHASLIMTEIDEALDRHPGSREIPEVAESLANLRSVFRILEVRARELLARARDPEQWVLHSVSALRTDFVENFAAMEKNSHGRFHFAFDPSLRRPTDYLLMLEISAVGGGGVWMPAAIPDVIRDLAANARKYTAPGGEIIVRLHADAERIKLQVEDTGRGIPADDIGSVVHFGKRGSNVGDVRTRGGGFGLTKAFFIAKQFGGRFWIASELGRGTRVRLEIPVTRPEPQSL
jgi:signal transduction histidine kinase